MATPLSVSSSPFPWSITRPKVPIWVFFGAILMPKPAERGATTGNGCGVKWHRVLFHSCFLSLLKKSYSGIILSFNTISDTVMTITKKNGVEGKECSNCHIWKPLSEYFKDCTKGISQGGRHCRCKICYQVKRRSSWYFRGWLLFQLYLIGFQYLVFCFGWYLK